MKKILFALLAISLVFSALYFSAPSSEQAASEKRTSDSPVPSVGPATVPVGMKFIPGGNFLMGSKSAAFPDENPVHRVAISPFYMDETPVTYADFKKYAEGGGVRSRYWEYETYNMPDNPVTGVSWYHAIDYCNWRSEIEGFTPAYVKTSARDGWGYPSWRRDAAAAGYRLPTEAEFEYAARGGLEQKQFPWGDTFDSRFANYDDERGSMTGAWWRLAKVKDAPLNDYGLYGMSGNIWHWTDDWYETTSYADQPGDNPSGPQSGSVKALRGGSWGSIDPQYLRVAKRSWSAPDNYNYDIGFRCVRPATAASLLALKRTNAYAFYRYPSESKEQPLALDPYGEAFAERLGKFIREHYPNSIYFETEIDEQKVLAPKEMAALIVKVAKEYKVHPLFLTGIIAAESGFGCCSFPRWYNNPMAYHWQNALMKSGPPLYDADASRNRKYKNLEAGFKEFAKGIRRDVYFISAQKDLNAFHFVYVGYPAEEWMHTIAKVYRDVLGIRFESHFPETNAGRHIYTDWETRASLPPSAPSFPLPALPSSPPPSVESPNIVNRLVSWGYETPAAPRAINTIILHSSYDALGTDVYSVSGVMAEYEMYRVSPHYLIDREGIVYRLVEDKNVAYHAGTGAMPNGRTNINSFSIGIELINTTSTNPNETQYRSLGQLVKSLKSKYPIQNIVGHSQIAPGRKTDPWNFDWQKFNASLK